MFAGVNTTRDSARSTSMQAHRKVLCGVVVSAGKMMKAVKVRTAKQVYNSFLKKVSHFLICSIPCSLFHLLQAPVKELPAISLSVTQHFQTYESHLVSDPNSSLRAGDVVRIASGWHASKHISHVVTEIVSPWGLPIDERPKIPSEEELLGARIAKKEAKMERRAQRMGNGDNGAKESRPGDVETLKDVAK